MSAGAVRQGGVFVEIGADSKAFVGAMAQVNRQIASVGSLAVEVGAKLGGIGAAITAPLAAAAAQFADLGSLLKDIQVYAGLSSRDIGGLTKAAADLGLVIDKQTATAALQLAASTTKMRLSLLAVAATVGSVVAPEFTGFAETVSRVARGASVFLRENRKIITVALAVGGALTGVGVVLTSVGGAMKAFAGNTSFLIGPIVQLIRSTALLAANMLRLSATMGTAGVVGAATGTRSALAGLLGVVAGLGKAIVAVTARFAGFAAILGASAAGASLAVFFGLVSMTTAAIATLAFSIGYATEKMFVMRAALTVSNAAFLALGASQKTFSLVSFLLAIPKSVAAAGAGLLRLGIAVLSIAGSIATVTVGLGAIAAAVYVFGGAALKAVGGFDGIRKAAGNAVTAGIDVFNRAMPGMVEVTQLTVTGAYNAIASGDFAGAVGILWDGAKAAWTVGSAAIMGVLDPWIETVQNAWGNMVTFLLNAWDRGFASLATTEWGGAIIGAMDNVTNAVLASWDYMVGSLQKGWAYLTSQFKAGIDLGAEFARIDRENQARARERARLRPGIEGRTGLTDEEKARIQGEAEARIRERIMGNERAQQDRRRRTEERAAERPGAIADAIGNLRGRIKDVEAAKPGLAPIVPQQVATPSQVAGTFSAFAARGLTATKGIPEQQVDLLRQIAANTKEGARVGP